MHSGNARIAASLDGYEEHTKGQLRLVEDTMRNVPLRRPIKVPNPQVVETRGVSLEVDDGVARPCEPADASQTSRGGRAVVGRDDENDAAGLFGNLREVSVRVSVGQAQGFFDDESAEAVTDKDERPLALLEAKRASVDLGAA